MKIFPVLLLCIAFSINSFSQVFKTTDIFNNTNATLSHWQVLEKNNVPVSDSFQLWGIYQYSESVNASYEVQFFKGDVKSTFDFIENVISFTEKYKSENKIISLVKNTQMKTYKGRFLEYTMIYDKERKVAVNFNLKQLLELRDKFILYCKNNNIVIQ